MCVCVCVCVRVCCIAVEYDDWTIDKIFQLIPLSQLTSPTILRSCVLLYYLFEIQQFVFNK